MSGSRFSHFHANESKTIKLGNPYGIKYEKQEKSDQHNSSERRGRKVDIYHTDGTLILHKAISEGVLKRFSKHARSNLSTEDPKNPTYTIPSFHYRQPDPDAVKWLMAWCEDNNGTEKAPAPNAGDVGGDLLFKINVYATMENIEFFLLPELSKNLQEIMNKEPISVEELKANWELLGKDAGNRVVERAVTGLNKSYKRLRPEERRQIDQYRRQEEELDQAFRKDRESFLARLRSTAQASGSPAGTNGGDTANGQEGSDAAAGNRDWGSGDAGNDDAGNGTAGRGGWAGNDQSGANLSW